MLDKRVFLRIKINSLAEESRIIRREEIKSKKRARYLRKRQGANPDYLYREECLLEDLQTHRRINVRHEARHAHVAASYLRGTPYRAVEAKCHPGSGVNFEHLWRLIRKFGSSEHKRSDLTDWLECPLVAA